MLTQFNTLRTIKQKISVVSYKIILYSRRAWLHWFDHLLKVKQKLQFFYKLIFERNIFSVREFEHCDAQLRESTEKPYHSSNTEHQKHTADVLKREGCWLAAIWSALYRKK